MSEYWILVNKEPKPVSFTEWFEWFETADRHVGNTVVGKVHISTIFLSIDHSFGSGKPLLFETMIFGGKHDQYQTRCTTWDEAVKMHEKALDIVGGTKVRANARPKRKLARITKTGANNE